MLISSVVFLFCICKLTTNLQSTVQVGCHSKTTSSSSYQNFWNGSLPPPSLGWADFVAAYFTFGLLTLVALSFCAGINDCRVFLDCLVFCRAQVQTPEHSRCSVAGDFRYLCPDKRHLHQLLWRQETQAKMAGLWLNSAGNRGLRVCSAPVSLWQV